MRASHSLILALLPSLTLSAEQIPLTEKATGWFNKAKSYVPTAAKAPVSSSAAKVAAEIITPITRENWESTLSPTPDSDARRKVQGKGAATTGPDTWLVLITGGNKTCHGRCTGVEQAFNQSAALLAADPTSPKLGILNCDRDAILCGIWAANVPTLWHIERPVPDPDQSRASTTIRIIDVNTTTITAPEIVQLHTQKGYLDAAVYEGAFHPFNGWLARYQLNKAIGYVLFGVSVVPSWAFMIVVSMVSRQFM